ncbi:MAG: crossover junction endodeoxyribonuclease RuvC [Candidatus Moranbacteria bacterium RIFOXYA12_FULL_35_19]|nr:MAG: Crossover junction endodeoxyribonuclease RuvC [Candidatus Moranbacteria bacterium GW2011_GWF2_35_39]OGI33458.1 MAG: crossover junction endodeoxyribonuclease RuvC [Candidatus Moranbacteria bacterium RIFOXYC12_FULL_36_13]OGI36555.1 MAG: crossover junction endodeoxyribonuclease RuvC [Candidatus Moranbacteria bacterium RIFOXYA12_FULL_35_19]
MKQEKKKLQITNCALSVLGVDPGTATTGWAILCEKNGIIKPVAYGHIATSPKKSDDERILEISKDLRNIIEKYQPREAGVEEIFFFKNQKTIITVAQARGAILLTLGQNNVKVSSYTPLQVKQALTGYGRAEKKQVQLMTQNILNLAQLPKPDDTADAIAIALCHINSRKLNSLK